MASDAAPKKRAIAVDKETTPTRVTNGRYSTRGRKWEKGRCGFLAANLAAFEKGVQRLGSTDTYCTKSVHCLLCGVDAQSDLRIRGAQLP